MEDTATNQVSFTLNPTTGLDVLETGSLEDRQFTYTVTDPDGNNAEGGVELQLWTMPTPPDLGSCVCGLACPVSTCCGNA